FSDHLQENYAANLPEDGKEFVDKIISSSERMTQLIDDLLDLSRLSQLKNGFIAVDLNLVIQDVLVDFEVLMKEKKATIVFKNRLPEIWANRLQMQQLFHNLLSNSLKFARDDRSP